MKISCLLCSLLPLLAFVAPVAKASPGAGVRRLLRHSLKEDETASVARDFDFVGIQEFLDSLQANSQVDDEEWDRKSKAACATILYYENHECTGEPTRTYTVPTMTMPGSPCQTDATMCHSSVKDQYCDLESGAFYETFYPFNTQCKTHWYDAWSVIHLRLQQGTCVHGILLRQCHKGKCRGNNETNATEVVEVYQVDNEQGAIQ